MSRHCYVVNCSQCDYQLKRNWSGVKCDKHGVFHGDSPCDCDPPFRLFPFPGKVRAPEARQMWLKAINRADPKKPHTWLDPTRSQMVCSNHFRDGYPSVQHPYPELHLGDTLRKRAGESEMKENRKRRLVEREEKQGEIYVAVDVTEEPVTRQMSKIGLKFIIFMLLSVIKRLREEISTRRKENVDLIGQMNAMKGKQKSVKPTIHTTCTSSLLKKDRDVNFFTGIGTRSLFNKLHDYVGPFVRRRWKGLKSRPSGIRIRLFNRSPSKFGPNHKLKSIDEFLLTLMKLRLGLLNEDLAKRFHVSIALVSQIFHSWLATMSEILGKVVLWPTKEQVIASKPSRFAKLPDLRCIIDCSEVFIETPKDPNLQNATWSNYKHHNTMKFLVGIAPNSAITFLSPVYGGRTTDKEATLDSGFLDKYDPYDMIQADKGFNIQEECDARLLSLHVPPGKRGSVQMTSVAVEKTKRIANLRILVEQVIRRLKTFRILSGQLPLTLAMYQQNCCCVCINVQP